MIVRCAPFAFAVVVALLSGCRKPTVEAYRVPKEASAPAPATPANTGGAPAAGPAGGNAMANTAVPVATGAALTWTAPSHWKSVTGSAMRRGSYTITAEGGAGEADMSITAFPGDVGGDLANLNRWRGQIGLPPVGQAEFESSTLHLDRNDLHMTVADIVGAGPNPQRILGAMVPHEGSTWFFKMQGPDAVVAKEKPAFMAMLDTVKPAVK